MAFIADFDASILLMLHAELHDVLAWRWHLAGTAAVAREALLPPVLSLIRRGVTDDIFGQTEAYLGCLTQVTLEMICTGRHVNIESTSDALLDSQRVYRVADCPIVENALTFMPGSSLGLLSLERLLPL